MKQKTKRGKKSQTMDAAIIETGHLVEFMDTPGKGRAAAKSPVSNHKRATPSKPGFPSTPADYDRIRLRDLEVLLNNGLILAQKIQTKAMAKIMQLLRDARTNTQDLRG